MADGQLPAQADEDFSRELSPSGSIPTAASAQPLNIPESPAAANQWLTEDDFETGDLPLTTAPSEPPRPVRIPGPGLPEALGWTMGVFAAHIAATLALVILIVMLMSLSSGGLNAIDFEKLPPSYLLVLLGGDQMLVLLAALVAASFRFRGQLARCLNVTLPRPLHLLLIAGLMLPLSALSGEIYRVTDQGWSLLIELLEQQGLGGLLTMFEGANTVEWLQEMAHIAPLPVMLLIIAVGPALGEELVFRGVIGRGLVARWGMWPGVLLTSILFAAVHFHPVHVIAVIPLGIAMHLSYLATRSFWAPVWLHFLNNSWATIATRVSTGEEQAAVMDAAASPALLTASIIAVIVLGAFLYHTRARYVLADGTEWSPGYLTAEQPPQAVGARLDYGHGTGRNLALAATAWVSFAVAFVAEIAAFAK